MFSLGESVSQEQANTVYFRNGRMTDKHSTADIGGQNFLKDLRKFWARRLPIVEILLPGAYLYNLNRFREVPEWI